jgi:hypothetical protein
MILLRSLRRGQNFTIAVLRKFSQQGFEVATGFETLRFEFLKAGL